MYGFVVRKIANVSFFNEHNEIFNKNIEYEWTKNRTLWDPS